MKMKTCFNICMYMYKNKKIQNDMIKLLKKKNYITKDKIL